MEKSLRVTGYIFVFVVLLGCANYASRIRDPRNHFEHNEYDKASEELKKLVERNDNDQLLYLMDLGIVYFSSGQYKDAITIFTKAEKLSEITDYTSLSQEIGSVVFNDQLKVYKGEHFEKILINVYLAMSYTLLGEWDSALVECRKVNHKLDLMISEGKLPYEQNAFAKYLAATLFEARQEYNDAFVDYRTLIKWGKTEFPYLGSALLRVSRKLGALQEFEEYQKKFPSEKKYTIEKNQGEVILLLEVGYSPIKVSHPNFHLLPKFRKREFLADHALIRSNQNFVRTYPLFDIEQTAIKELDHRTGAIIAKKVGGIVAKEIIADQVAKQTNSKALGVLTSLALHLSDQADLRSWSTLPSNLQIARMVLPSGVHDINLDVVLKTGEVLKGVKIWSGVTVKGGQKIFLNHRIKL